MRSNDMASEKALYWMAVGVAALFLGNHYVSRFDSRCLADRSLAAVQGLSGPANRFMAMAEVMLDRTSTNFDRTQSAVANAQTQFVSMQTAITRQEVDCVRVQAEQARTMALQQVRQMRLEVVCPRQTLKLNAPRLRAAPQDGTI
jgi:hypothetical protein